jgi:hypothetical protein
VDITMFITLSQVFFAKHNLSLEVAFISPSVTK